MMTYIEEERARLWGDYTMLLDRLRTLDEIENPIIAKEEHSVDIEDIGPDSSDDEPIEEEPVEDFEPTTLEEYLEKNSTPVVEEPISIIPKTEIEALKDKDQKNRKIKSPTRGASSRDIKVIAQYVKAVLKEAGVPMKTSELISRLGEIGIDVSSPYGMLMQVRAYEPKIEKASFGYYQYKW